MPRPHPLLQDLARGLPIAAAAVDTNVAASAMEHRVAGLLLSALGDDLAAVKAEPLELLMAFDMAVEARRHDLMSALDEVVERLEAHRIQHVVFKGLGSATRWYENPIERPFNDLDLVVDPSSDVAAAVAAIYPDHPDLGRLASGGNSSEFFTLELDGVTIDVHSDPYHMGIRPLHPDLWWTSTFEFHSAGTRRPLRLFKPELDLVLFVLHQARDRFRYLLGVIETRLRLRQDVDWHSVETLARAEGIWEQVSVGLSILCEEAGVKCPVEAPTNWRTTAWRLLWRPKVRLLGEAGRLRHIRRATWLMPMLTRGRSADALAWLIRSAFPSDDDLRLRHPDATGPYLWRLIAPRIAIVRHRHLSSAHASRSAATPPPHRGKAGDHGSLTSRHEDRTHEQ